MNRFSTARGNAPAPVTVTGSASFRSARAESRRAAARSARPPALPAVRRTDRAGDDRTAEGSGSLRTAFGSALFAMPVAAVAGLIFLLIAAGTVCAMPDPDSLITPLGLSVLGLTVLCGGFVCSRRAGCAIAVRAAVRRSGSAGSVFGLALLRGCEPASTVPGAFVRCPCRVVCCTGRHILLWRFNRAEALSHRKHIIGGIPYAVSEAHRTCHRIDRPAKEDAPCPFTSPACRPADCPALRTGKVRRRCGGGCLPGTCPAGRARTSGERVIVITVESSTAQPPADYLPEAALYFRAVKIQQ